jgi:hypothetical protein
MSAKREFYKREGNLSSEGRSYGGGKEGFGHGGGYPAEQQASKKHLGYKQGERIFETASFKQEGGYGEKGTGNHRAPRLGLKAKSQRKGQRKH